MHRIDGPGHDNNMFTEGNATLGIPRTVVTDDWANAVQEEIVAAITASGLALDKPANTQLRQALRRLFGGNVTTVVFADSPKALGADNAGLVLIDASGGNVVINLPVANLFVALRYLLVRTDNSGNTVTVNRAGADTIDTALTSFPLAGQGDSAFIYSNGADGWRTAAPKGVANGYASLDGAGKVVQNIDAAKVTSGVLDTARIPNLDASKVTSGVLDTARIPNLDAAKITTGTFPQDRIGAGAVGSAELKSAFSDNSITTAISTQFLFSGGEYNFFPSIAADQNGGGSPIFAYGYFSDADGAGGIKYSPIVTSNSGGAVTFVCGIKLYGEGFSGTTDFVIVRNRYISSSPPYDLGDGEVPLFVFVLLDAAGRIWGTSIAMDPPWAYNGPTNIRPTHYRGQKAMQWRRKHVPRVAPDASEAQIAAYVEALRNPTFEEVEITQALKQADMPLLPHPWCIGNDLTGKTVVLLDPTSPLMLDLLAIHELGESSADRVPHLLHREYIQIDNTTLNRCSPPGVAVCGFRWRNSKR